MLSDNPHASHFTVNHLVKALACDGPAPPIALFAAAGVLGTPDAVTMSGGLTSALGMGMAFGGRSVFLPRSLLRRKVPRTSLALLVHSVATLLESSEGALRERWTWVLHPLMTGALGVILFLLGLVSMAPIVGGGVQHAASAFFIALGIAERDGLAVMIGALAGIACLALAVLSVSSGKKLWVRIKAWLLQCARRLRLDALARMLDHCCDGLGELVRLRWSGLLLIMISPDTAESRHPGAEHAENAGSSVLRRRAQRARSASSRAYAEAAP